MRKETLELKNKIMMLEIEVQAKEAVIDTLIDRLRTVRLAKQQEITDLKGRLNHAEVN